MWNVSGQTFVKWHAWITAIGLSFEHWTLVYGNTKDSTGTWDSLLNCERSTPWYMGTRDINDGIGHIQHTSTVVHKKKLTHTSIVVWDLPSYIIEAVEQEVYIGSV